MTIRLDPKLIAEYQAWEQAANTDLPGRYAMGFRGAAVFSLYDQDTPVASQPADCAGDDGHITLWFADPPASFEARDLVLGCADIRALLSQMEGQTTFGHICKQCSGHLPEEQVRRLVQGLLGQAVFLPDAIQELEHRIRRVEIVRFPIQSPYLVLREYWSNCGDVREHVGDLLESLGSNREFRAALSDLHILATLGADLETRYGGSGGIPTVPGGYRTHPVRTGLATRKSQFIDEHLKRLGLRPIRRDEYFAVSETGILLGAVAEEGRVFRHPPAEGGYLDKLLEETRISMAGAREDLIEGRRDSLLLSLSRFHKFFLHAHPFYNINNSIAMNIVNYCLSRAGFGVIPHLLLDFIALRADFDIYAEVFIRAVRDYAFGAASGSGEDEALSRILQDHRLVLSTDD